MLLLPTAGVALSFALAEAALKYFRDDVERGGNVGAGFIGAEVVTGYLVEPADDKSPGRRACAGLTEPDAGPHGTRLLWRDAADPLLNRALEVGGEGHPVGSDEDVHAYSPR